MIEQVNHYAEHSQNVNMRSQTSRLHAALPLLFKLTSFSKISLLLPGYILIQLMVISPAC